MASRVTIQIQYTEPASSGSDVQSYNIGYVNPALLQESDRGATKIDTCARAINGLTGNTYVDTLLVTTESVSELING